MTSLVNAFKKDLEKTKKLITFELREKYFPGMDAPQIRETLRKMGFSGHENIQVNSTGVLLVVLREDGSVVYVLQRRRDANNTMGVFGGAAKPEESPEDCAVREALEEIGLNPKFAEKIIVKEIYTSKDYRKYPSEDEMAFVMTNFIMFTTQKNLDENLDESLRDIEETSGIALCEGVPNDDELFVNHKENIKKLYEETQKILAENKQEIVRKLA